MSQALAPIWGWESGTSPVCCLIVRGWGSANTRAGNEQCSWFGEHVFVFVVLFGVRILNVFGFVFGVFGVRCSGIVLFCSVFGVYVLLCSVFGMVVCSVFGQAGSPLPLLWARSGGCIHEHAFVFCSCSSSVPERAFVFSSCSCSGSLCLCSCSCSGNVLFCS